MNCREVCTCLPEYVEGTLRTRDDDAVVTHLAGCAACREENRLLTATRHLLATHGPTRVPSDFSYLAARLPVARRRAELLLWFRRSLVASTAAAALAGFAWQWQRPAPVPTPLRVVVSAEVEELHQAYAVQQSLDARDGLLLFAPEWAERER